MQLGIPMEKSLDNLIRRIPSDDLDLVVTAINVQREVGGNLAEILETISHTIRERIRLKGEIRTLTAQVMYSGTFLSLLPVILSFILLALNRPYMMMFFNPETRMCGIPMLVCGFLMIVSGYITMRRIADIEV
jgi:tight adherence protein B